LTALRSIHKSQIWKIRPLGAELFLAEGWTVRHEEANIRFPEFCECA